MGQNKQQNKSHLKPMSKKELWEWFLAHGANWERIDEKHKRF